jgi:alanine-synthesizing transaminase
MFAWAPIPERFAHLGSLEFSKLLLKEANVAVSPGLGFGEYGDGYVRLALVENVQRIRQATRNIKAFLNVGEALPEPPTQKNMSVRTGSGRRAAVS